MTKDIFICELCEKDMWGIPHANNEILSETNSATIGCTASEEDDETTPTLCIDCGCENHIV